MNGLSSINSEEIISILKEEIENFDMATGVREVGNVIWVGDGIATVYGIDHAMYGEIVTFENGVKGMVQDIKRNEIGVIIFGKDTGIKEGTKVARTKKRAGIPVGEGYIGRVVLQLMEKVVSKRKITVQLKMKHQVLLTVNPLPYRWKQEFLLLTPCCQSVVDKEN